MSDLKLTFAAATGKFEKAFKEMSLPMATAATGAVREAAEDIKVEGRQDIAAAGFSGRWQNALRVEDYPKGKTVSMGAAALIHHKIPYAEVFESGAMIRGKPLLWLPLSSTKKMLGREKMTPKLYEAKIGPLTFVKRSNGKAPLLFGGASNLAQSISDIRIAGLRRRARKTHAAGLSNDPTEDLINQSAGQRRALRGAMKKIQGRNEGELIPLFVGVPIVSIRKRFSIRAIIQKGVDRLGDLYFKHLKPDGV